MTPETIRSQQRTLHAHRVLLRAGLSLVSAFAWVFVFDYAGSFTLDSTKALLVACIVYALSQFVLMFATPLAAAHLRHGTNRAMVFGACIAALSFAVLGATLAGYFSPHIGWGLALFGMLFGAYRALYWIPYRLQAGTENERHIPFELLLAVLPAFSGLTLATVFLSSQRLLFGAAALMCLSIVPVFFLRDTRETFEWRYGETFAKLFDVRYSILALRATLSGIESAALFLLWPIFVFLIVGGSYLLFGLVMSASLLALLAARSLFRDLRERAVPDGSVSFDVAVSAVGWALRIVAGTPFMVVFADSYSYVSAPAGSPEFVSRELRADGGSYLDEYTALQEIGLAFGRVVMCLFAIILVLIAPLSVAFAVSLIAAAFAAGAATALSHKTRLGAY